MGLRQTRTQALAKRLFAQYSLDGWRLIICDTKKDVSLSDIFGEFVIPGSRDGRLGFCYDDRMVILLHFELPARWSVRQTLLHEIAHALTDYDAGHGKAFREKAAEIGCSQKELCPYLNDQAPEDVIYMTKDETKAIY